MQANLKSAQYVLSGLYLRTHLIRDKNIKIIFLNQAIRKKCQLLMADNRL